MSNYRVTFKPGTKNHCWNKAFDLVREGSEVLDVGCSYGGFGRALIRYKHCVVDGIEPDDGDSKQAAEVLRKVHNGYVESAFATTLRGRLYDHIVFLDVIEHLYDPAKTLADIKKHLKPGGTIIFSIPNMAHISVRLMLLDGKFEYGETGLLDNTHLHFYTKQEITRVFEKAGLSVNVWDHTEAVYPKELLVSNLQKRGFTPSEKALKILSDASANIFQYVGSAVVAKTRRPKIISYSPDPQGEISKLYEKRISRYEQKLHEKESQITALQNMLNDKNFLMSKISAKEYATLFVRRKLKSLQSKLTKQ